MNKFDQHIKNSLESFEADYNPADWADMQNRLSQAQPAKSSNTIGKALLIAASLLATAGAVYYFTTADNSKEVTADNKIRKAENTIAVKTNDNVAVQPIVKEEQNVAANNSQGNNTPSQNNSSADNKQNNKNNTPELAPAPVAPENKNTANNSQPVQNTTQPVQSADNAAANAAAFHTDVTKICEGGTVQFMPDNADPTSSYKWYFGDKVSSSEASPKHGYSDAGTYPVTLTVRTKEGKQYVQKGSVVVGALPVARIRADISEENPLRVSFEADGDRITEWKWNFADGKTSGSQNLDYTYVKYGKYPVTLTVKNAAGCSATFNQEVNLQLDLGASNGFAPDADGSNGWMPNSLRNGEYPVFTLTIFDKAGKQVFQTKDANDAWDGNNTTAFDTFRWVAVVKAKNGQEVSCNGLITIKK